MSILQLWRDVAARHCLEPLKRPSPGSIRYGGRPWHVTSSTIPCKSLAGFTTRTAQAGGVKVGSNVRSIHSASVASYATSATKVVKKKKTSSSSTGT